MNVLYYDHPEPSEPIPRSIFLAGPTARSGRDKVDRAGLPNCPITAWRGEVLELLKKDFDGTIVVPEFEFATYDGFSSDMAFTARFGRGRSEVPNMRTKSYNILKWETAGIENVSVVLFWMPFSMPDTWTTNEPYLPGYTTRAEVSRELVRDKTRVVLGMPVEALSGSHIRFHAHNSGVPIYTTLEETVEAARKLVSEPRPSLGFRDALRLSLSKKP